MRKTNKIICYYLFSVMFIFPWPKVMGQAAAGKADAETMKLIGEATPVNGKETGAVIILKDYQMTINEKSQTRLVLRILGKVFTREALSDYSQIPLGYNSYYEEPHLNYARVIRPDGTIREVPGDAVQIKTAPESEGLQYTDSRYLSFALSGLEVGAAFDFQVTFTQKIPIIEGEWYDNHLFPNLLRTLSPPFVPRIDPTLTSRYTLLVPKGSKFTAHMYSGEGEPTKRSLKSQDEYEWVFKNLPAVKFEDGMPPLSKINTILVVSSMDDWSKVDKWAAGRLLSKAEVTDEIKSLAKQLTSDIRNDEFKIKAIADYIQGNIHYIYADLDRGGYTPHPAGEILKSKYGDCKDQSVLLISMLKAIGIEAFPALLNPFPYDEMYEVPGPEFSHMITYIPRPAGELWLDMTSGVTPFPNLFASDQGRMAFIVNGKGGRFAKTPVDDISRNFSHFDLTTTFSEGKEISDMTISASGIPGDMLKSVFKGIDPDQREEGMKAMIKSNMEKASVDSVRFSDVNNPAENFFLNAKFALDSMWRKGQADCSFGSHSSLPLSLLANLDVQSYPPKRNYDLIGAYRYSISGTEKYTSPVKDLLTLSFPKNDSMRNEFFTFIRTFTRKGDVTVANWKFSLIDPVIPKEKYSSYLEALKSLREMASWNITCVDPVPFIASVMQSVAPDKITAFSNDLIKTDPKNMLPYLLKGMVTMMSGQVDPAIKLFEEARRIDLFSKYPYVYLYFAQMAKRNVPQALQYLNKSIELDPEYETALMLRGSYNLEKGSYEKALSDYDRLIKADPKNIFYLERKSVTLSAMGKEAESIAVLEDAVKKDTANADLYAVLAERYLQGSSHYKAIALYVKAISIDATKANFYGNLGWAYYLADNDEKCIEFSSKAIDIDPKSYYARYNLGLANLRSGKITEARNIYGELQKEKESITRSARQGAIKDLNELKAKGLYPKEVKSILKDFFDM